MRWFPSDRKGRKVSQTSIAVAVNYLVSPIIIFSLCEFRENVVSVAESLTLCLLHVHVMTQRDVSVLHFAVWGAFFLIPWK